MLVSLIPDLNVVLKDITDYESSLPLAALRPGASHLQQQSLLILFLHCYETCLGHCMSWTLYVQDMRVGHSMSKT